MEITEPRVLRFRVDGSIVDDIPDHCPNCGSRRTVRRLGRQLYGCGTRINEATGQVSVDGTGYCGAAALSAMVRELASVLGDLVRMSYDTMSAGQESEIWARAEAVLAKLGGGGA